MALTYQPYNISLPSYSPVCTYLPYRDGDPWTGWNSSYQASTYSTSSEANPCEGDWQFCRGTGIAFRTTSLDWASLNVNFNGTAIYLCLGYDFGSYIFTVDGKQIVGTAPQGDPACAMYGGSVGTIVVADNLALTEHNATLHGYYSGLDFYGAIVTISAGQPGPKKVEVVDDSDSQWKYEGDWALQTDDYAMWNGNYHSTAIYQPNSSASYTFEGASAVILRGLSMCNYGPYTVTLNDQTGSFNQTASFNASDLYWRHSQSVLYFAGGLDSAQSYTITLVNYDSNYPNATPLNPLAGCNGLAAAVDTLSLIVDDTVTLDALRATAPSLFASPTVTPSTIAAAVLGSLLFLLLAVNVVFITLTQRRKRGTPNTPHMRPSPLIPIPWVSEVQPGQPGDPALNANSKSLTKWRITQERSDQEERIPPSADLPPTTAVVGEREPTLRTSSPQNGRRTPVSPNTLGDIVTTLSQLHEYLQQEASEGLPEYQTNRRTPTVRSNETHVE